MGYLRHRQQRAVFQASYCWSQMMIKTLELTSPGDWGWKRSTNEEWEVEWTSLPEAAQVCRELIRCGCKKECRGHCKCLKAELQCTALCKCGGICSE